MKKLRIICTLLALVIICSLSIIPATANSSLYYYTNKYFTRNEGGFLGIGQTNYTYKIYQFNASLTHVFHNKPLCPIIYHRQNGGSTSLTYSISNSYSSQTSFNFSNTIGVSIGVADLVSSSANATRGQTNSYTQTYAATGLVGRTIPSSTSNGYYKMNICYNYNQFRLDKYQTGSSSKIATYYHALPVGRPYVGVLRGSTTVDSSFRLQYP